MYEDVRHEKDKRVDKNILQGIWKLLDEADVIIWHYGDAFDRKKLNARFVLNGFKKPSPYAQIDTKKLASKTFGFTSNKLEYLADKLGCKYKKSKHKKFEGFDMWKECMAGNIAAFDEMKKYNKLDVLALEAVYHKIQAWHQPVNFGAYGSGEIKCNCGSAHVTRSGYTVTQSGKYIRYKCQDCGSWSQDKKSILDKSIKAKLKKAL